MVEDEEGRRGYEEWMDYDEYMADYQEYYTEQFVAERKRREEEQRP